MNKKIQIILAEDEPAILRGLSANITQFSGDYEIISTAYNGEDALAKIKKMKPDIVITDIRMPLMDGLDLIEAASKISPNSYFVILTGYAEFEYAKRAMKLQVIDYLLKPVDPDVLEELLEKLKGQIAEKREKEIRNYLTQKLHGDTTIESVCPLLSDCTVYLLFTFYGAVTASRYSELTTGSLIVNDSDYGFLPEIADLLNVCIYALRGNHRNETVFAIIVRAADITDTADFPMDSSRAAKKAAQLIHGSLLTEVIFINCFLSWPIADGLDIPSHVRSCYLCAASWIIFGQSHLMDCKTASAQDKSLSAAPEVKELLKFLKPTMLPDEIDRLSKGLVTYWEKQNVTQLQIQTELRFCFSAAAQNTYPPHGIAPDPTELLASSPSYKGLYHNLTIELNRLYAGQEQVKIPHTQELAAKIRDYLGQNYTQAITYKNFTKVFGYNEKYVSCIFKGEYGISPSKYILELRLTAAKNLMRQNPNMLLKDVAEAVGYDDQLYFSRVFKNSEGISPKAYQSRLY